MGGKHDPVLSTLSTIFLIACIGLFAGFLLGTSFEQINTLYSCLVGWVIGIIGGVILSMTLSKNKLRSGQLQRANREAEKQKQIDAMQRKASNIPKVTR